MSDLKRKTVDLNFNLDRLKKPPWNGGFFVVGLQDLLTRVQQQFALKMLDYPAKKAIFFPFADFPWVFFYTETGLFYVIQTNVTSREAGIEISSENLLKFHSYDQHIYLSLPPRMFFTFALELRLSKTSTSFNTIFKRAQGVLC
jgi:hypothetical protein